MRFVSYDMLGGPVRPGVLVEDTVVDLSDDFEDLLGLIDAEASGQRAVTGHLAGGGKRVPVAHVRLHAPVVPRRNLWAVGWNYAAHFEEGVGRRQDNVREIPPFPAFFSKAPTCVIGPYDPVAYDAALSSKLDFETELAVVIGAAGRNIPRERALSHVFGYAVANDITVRDIQRRHGGQWMKGKSIDRTCPLGPYIVTCDEIPAPQELEVTTRVNGVVMQKARTSAMLFPIDTLISELSVGMTLFPGDVILTGTPDGVGYSRTPEVYLCPGDTVLSEIGGVGRLENKVAAVDLTSYKQGLAAQLDVAT